MNDLDSLYQDIILDHAKRQLNAGLRDPFDAEVLQVNPTCGDEITLRVRLDDAPDQPGGQVVGDISYDNQGCSISTAAASVMTDLLIGKPVEEAERIYAAYFELLHGKGRVEPDEELLEDAVAFQGAARLSARVKCALLSWMAYHDAITRSREANA